MARGVSVIAIDGPVAAGKTAVGRELARTLGFGYLDTGIMYRAITWLALKNGIPVDDPDSLGELARANPLEMMGDDSDRVSVAGHTLGPELREPSVDGNDATHGHYTPLSAMTATVNKAVNVARTTPSNNHGPGTVINRPMMILGPIRVGFLS